MAVSFVSIDVGYTNMGVCAGRFLPEKKHFPFCIEHWELLDLETVQLKEATEAVHQMFEERSFLSDNYDWVLIENQIDDILGYTSKQDGAVGGALYKVGRMKALGAAIHSYFYGRRCWRRENKAAHIAYISARGKLKVYQGNAPIHIPAKKTRREHNKEVARAHMKAMLAEAMQQGDLEQETGERMLTWFNSLRNKRGVVKNDDVADAFLQAAYWCINKTRWRGGDGTDEVDVSAEMEEEEVERASRFLQGPMNEQEFAFDFSS